MNRSVLLTACILLLINLGCGHQDGQHQRGNATNLYVILNVSVLPMTDKDTLLSNVNVVIRDHRIESINGPIPDSATRIDGTNKWLLPGFIDMHVHGFADINFGTPYPTQGATFFVDDQDVMTLYLANGVTTIFDLNARAENFAQRNAIQKGRIIGPRMALAALINGGDGDGRIANNPEDGRQSVRMAKAEGYEFIKVYSQLDEETFLAIVDEANRQHMKVVGHIPNSFIGKTQKAFVPGFNLVAHAEEFAKQSKTYGDDDIQSFVSMAKASGTWLCPTLITIKRIRDQTQSLDSIRHLQGFELIHPLMQDKWINANKFNDGSNNQDTRHLAELMDFNNRLVKAFYQANIPLVTGTDAGCSGVVWGYALHDELVLLVQAGLSPKDALKSSTILPAKWLGIDHLIGTIEPGKFADLVLLNSNPMEDIHHTRNIYGVFANGQWLPQSMLKQMTDTVRTHHQKMGDRRKTVQMN
ncbi:MAG: amidohydrolase family protein [Flavobacteriales bacterium]|nr:amidohydrolase family protein [Flavobacteriales bacterium]